MTSKKTAPSYMDLMNMGLQKLFSVPFTEREYTRWMELGQPKTEAERAFEILFGRDVSDTATRLPSLPQVKDE